MATSYGQIRYRVSKEAPGVDLDLIDGYLLDRFTSILDRLKWRRLESNVVLTTVAPYSTGTVNATNGSANVTLTGGTWTSGMTGMAIAIDDRDEWYEFTYASPTTGTLDRAYQGTNNATASYILYQSIYTLPADCRIVSQLTLPGYGPLGRLAHTDLNAATGQKRIYGPPRTFSLYMDDGSTPPRIQIRLTPIPDAVYSIELDYIADASAPNASGTTTTLLPWLRPSALIAGATADALENLAVRNPQQSAVYFASADRHERKYETYVEDMVRTAGMERGPQPVRLAGWMTRHNLERAIRSARNRTGPRLP